MASLLSVPGFSWMGKNIGIKDSSLDFGVMFSAVPCQAAGVFTRNNFPGAPVVVGKEHLADGLLQAVVVNSKNANVATGPQGEQNARRVCRMLGQALDIPAERVLPSSTGVIGVPLPVEKIEAACAAVPGELLPGADGVEAFGRAIMTTDTRPKWISRRVGSATLTGLAKGSGMIEPNMATMLAFLATDAQVSAPVLGAMLRRVTEQTFNRVSVDTDTSTSDTAVILANGLAGEVDEAAFEAALLDICTHLAKEIARDGEGATKLLEVQVNGAPGKDAALAIAKSVVNSPLVKTAVYGADPNWGRFIMAVGKVFDHPVPLEGVRIGFGDPSAGLEISAQGQKPDMLAKISAYMKSTEVVIRLRVGDGPGSETVWGCDLTEGYIQINAKYTT
ncbi:MAG: bifunctional glutamate N-acetyltransferase/amino-acid acetyltransferase ArgJ [Deltaproteobacteria bacterium]|nr:bifunctional glutamate N-acetyltransferase/amino-acid acetyltransferase ArgJ [Deltaproteobacteria bacterium]